MTRRRIVFVVILALVCLSIGERRTVGVAVQLDGAALSQGDVLQFVMIPEKRKFTVVEDDSFLVAVLASCRSDSPDTAKFELLPPSPNFVKLLYPFRGLATSQALILVAPEQGDAGKHTVVVRAINCEGMNGTFTFTVKVKKP